MSNSSSLLVCFPCRKHRRFERYPSPCRKRQSDNAYSCPECGADMHHVGHKVAVPSHNDVKGWEEFHDFVTAPGFAGTVKGEVVGRVDEERERENGHWEGCRIRLKGPASGGGGPGRGCERCAEVEKRMPRQRLEYVYRKMY